MKLRYVVEYAAMRTVCAVLARLPYRLALMLAWCMAWFAHRVLGYRVKAARARIKSVLGPEIDDAKTKRIAWLAWRNFVFSLLDFVRLARTPAERLQVRVDGASSLALAGGLQRQGQYNCFNSHGLMGDDAESSVHAWDAAFTIGRPQKNPLANEYMQNYGPAWALIRSCAGLPPSRAFWRA